MPVDRDGRKVITVKAVKIKFLATLDGRSSARSYHTAAIHPT
jgi:hypothetical protein